MVFVTDDVVAGSVMRIDFGIYCSGIFSRMSNLDSPNMPPMGMPGLEAEKKMNERALSESQPKYMNNGNCKMPKGQYSQFLNLIKKLLCIIEFEPAMRKNTNEQRKQLLC